MPPIFQRLLESLQETSDLDVLQQLYLNDLCDNACPRVGQMVLRLLQAERTRRAACMTTADYPVDDPTEWPLDELLSGVSVAMGATKAAYAFPELPTVAQFCWRLVELFYAVMGLRLTGQYLEAVR